MWRISQAPPKRLPKRSRKSSRKCFYGIGSSVNNVNLVQNASISKILKRNNSSSYSVVSSGSYVPEFMLHVIHLYLFIAAKPLFHLFLYKFLFILCCCCCCFAKWMETSREEGNKTTERAVEEGRYIKGDPLNGYYDFIITEGSYKFWVVFQVRASRMKNVSLAVNCLIHLKINLFHLHGRPTSLSRFCLSFGREIT